MELSVLIISSYFYRFISTFRFGHVTDVYISRRNQHDDFNYAFVSFETESDAKAALHAATEDGVFLDMVLVV